MDRASSADRLMQLVALLADEQRRLELERSGTHVRKQRPDPPPFLDLTPYAHLSDVEVSQELGFTRRGTNRAAPEIVDERSGRYDAAVLPGRKRCEAGVKAWGMLRCHRMAVPAERWCQQHHPAPPPPLSAPARLHPWDLSLRPDGPLLNAIYELSDRVAAHTAAVELVLDRLQRTEAAAETVQPAFLSVKQAADYMGVSSATVYRMCMEHRLPYVRVGSHYRFGLRDLDAWLAARTTKPVR